MCGLFGWQLDAGRVAESERIALACTLVSLNDERGGDAWGFWTPDHEIDPVRGLGTMRSSIVAAQLAVCPTLCAHTRYATRGKAGEVKNAHPFEHRGVIGAHNGAVWNADVLDVRYPERSFDVDSQHLVAHIAERKPLDELIGYGAVVYTSRHKPGRVYMGRFCEGELEVATLTGERGLVWSSNRSHLYAALRLAGVGATILSVKPHRWYFADSGALVNTGEKIAVRSERAVRSISTPKSSDYADLYDSWTGKWSRTYGNAGTRGATGRSLATALDDGWETMTADGDDAGDDADRDTPHPGYLKED